MLTLRFVAVISLLTLISVSAQAVNFAENHLSDFGKHHCSAGLEMGTSTLAQNDGWAAFGAGTTGGAQATADQIYTVSNRQELIAALNNGVYPAPSSTPSSESKIIYVKGTIDANVDDDNQPLACEDYYTNGYTLEGYLAAYDPDVWGTTTRPSGFPETARAASRVVQERRIRIRVGSNTTIVGLGEDAVIRGAWLDLRGTSGVVGSRSNIIIRNITFQDTFDCFPQWDPLDGATGNWNSAYDMISLRDTDHVWINHNTFENITTVTPDFYFGRPFEVHDGQVDITNASNYVTVSWNRFQDHNKVMLIGSSDSATADRGKLNVTLHHNLFKNSEQRVPRVRFGQVHVYNNLYITPDSDGYSYSWGVGRESAIYAENNVFKTNGTIEPARFMTVLNGTAINASGSILLENYKWRFVDVLAEYNAANGTSIGDDVGWTPVLFNRVQPSRSVVPLVSQRAGPVCHNLSRDGNF